MSLDEQKLSERFNALFRSDDAETAVFSVGAQKAFELIVNEYMTYTGPTTNYGRFDGHVLECAAAEAGWQQRRCSGVVELAAEAAMLSDLYQQAANWLDEQARSLQQLDPQLTRRHMQDNYYKLR